MNYERLGQAFRCGNCLSELEPPKEPLTVKNEILFNSLTNHSALPVVVDFWGGFGAVRAKWLRLPNSSKSCC